MNPGICYLYEYKNDQKLRNVGFMKVTPHYRSCILQVNARGIPVQNGDSIKLLALYENDSESIAKPIDVLSCEDKNIYARLTISDSELPDGKTLEDLGGFLLQSPYGQYYAAISDNLTFHTDKVKMWEENPEPVMEAESLRVCPCVIDEKTSCEEPPENHMPESETKPEAKPTAMTGIHPKDRPEELTGIQPENTLAAMTGIQPEDTLAEMTEIFSAVEQPQHQLSDIAYNTPPEEPPESVPKSTSDYNQQSHEKVRKIQRSEISILPRRCWNLANNSFLMHGYHNYNHLLLVEEDGHFWLGVPGIYAPREARAAELFGFPQFTQTYTSQLELDEDERDNSEKFGYWCRFIR